MKPSQLLSTLRELGAKVWVEGRELKLSAPKGALTDELRAALKANKSELIAMLAPVSEFASASIPSVGRDKPLPLSSTQERLWFLDQLEPGLTAYNMWIGARLTGELDRAALERTFTEILGRQEVLRAHYLATESGPRQAFAPATQFTFSVLENERGLPTDAWRDEAQARLIARCKEPYDLGSGPLVRPLLAKISDTEHLLLVGLHHSVGDAWSIGLLLEEIGLGYAAFSSGAPSPLPRLPIQYGDYAAWQQGFLQSPEYERQLDFWCTKLGGELPVLEFPTDRQRPPVLGYGGDNERRPIGLPTLQALETFAQSEGATLFMALLALYQLLIRRTMGAEDVLVGTPIANRSRPELERLLGFFSNTLVIRSNLSGNPTFREFLRAVRDECLVVFENKDLPFERLVSELEPDRNLAYTPIFQTLFTLEEGSSERVKIGALDAELLDLTAKVARMDVTFGVFRNPSKASIWAEYRTDLFDGATIARLLASFHALLDGALAAPDTPIAELPLLFPEDRALVVDTWNDTGSGYDRDSSIVREFEARVREHPDKVAAVFAADSESGDGLRAKTLTYGELNERANRVAHHLIARGVGHEDLVGIVTERTLSMLVGILGILKAGAAYVPLDPGYPAERLAFMIEDAGLEVLLAQESTISNLPPTDAELVVLDGVAFDGESAENPPATAGPRSLAYVMFTSGSTGRPKGVCVEQRSVLRLVMDPNFCELGPDEVLLHFAPISFDASTFEVWGALLRGGKMVVYPPVEPSLDELGRVIREEGVTTAWLTAGLFSLMVEHQLESLGGMRQLLAGGDVLPVPQVNRVLRELPNLQLINGYGPTENTTFACCHPIPAGEELTGSVPIGRPISDTRVYIVDPSMQPVPIGVPGELLIGGHGVARGYLKRPELTAERFVDDPFSSEPGARLYATGDQARWMADGSIEFLGRRDTQVKVRGFRIELGEIETTLGVHESVRECVVVVREDVPGDKRIVAYVVFDGAELEWRDLRDYLKGKLPEYMLPAHFVVLEALPLSPNGKVDRGALPSPDPTRDVEAEYEAPRNEVERKMAEIWQEVLGVERVGVHDNFFELGGNSLLSTQAMARVRKAFDCEIPLRHLFEDPTVAGLSRRIGTESADEIAGRAYEAVFDRCLIPLQPRGWKTPLFIVSGAHAHEDDFLRFVGSILPHMSRDQPIYGFKVRGLDGVTPPHESAEAMAADYVREMRELQPQGPYLIAGNCVGGIVAFEMALQLKEAGEDVAMVGLLDTTAPVASYQEFVTEYYRFWRADRFVAHWRKLRELSAREKFDYVFDRVRRKARRVLPLSEETRRRKHVENVERRYSQVLAHYQPRPYDGRVTLIVNDEFQKHMPDAGWTPWVSGELDIHVVEGDHVTRLLENAEPTARLIEACIARAMSERVAERSAVG